eukprot:320552-Chlamydomonas_euryale.AAC.4
MKEWFQALAPGWQAACGSSREFICGISDKRKGIRAAGKLGFDPRPKVRASSRSITRAHSGETAFLAKASPSKVVDSAAAKTSAAQVLQLKQPVRGLPAADRKLVQNRPGLVWCEVQPGS